MPRQKTVHELLNENARLASQIAELEEENQELENARTSLLKHNAKLSQRVVALTELLGRIRTLQDTMARELDLAKVALRRAGIKLPSDGRRSPAPA